MITIDGYRIDAVISLDPTESADVTKHPVDEGADISDHIVTQPRRARIEGIVSNTPLSEVGRIGEIVNVSDAYELLRDIYLNKRLVDITSDSFPTFYDMALVSLSTGKNGPKDSLEFRANFEAINLVSVSSEARETLVEIPRARRKQRRGAKPTKDLDPETTPKPESGGDKGESWALSIGKFGGGILGL